MSGKVRHCKPQVRIWGSALETREQGVEMARPRDVGRSRSFCGGKAGLEIPQVLGFVPATYLHINVAEIALFGSELLVSFTYAARIHQTSHGTLPKSA